MRALCVAFGAASIAVVGPAIASAQPVGDARNGRILAQRLCSNCHVTGEGQESRRADVPSFAAIARRPQSTPERLAARIVLPHPEMPNVPLTRAELRDIIAYIHGLRAKP